MTWIDTIAYEESEDNLRKIYDRIKGPDDAIDNIMQAHSLRPHTLTGHMHLYKSVLHHYGNITPQWLLEAVGLFVSSMNGCTYCMKHHFQGMRRSLEDDARAFAIRDAIEADRLHKVFDEMEMVMMSYAETLTRKPSTVSERHIATLRGVGLDDAEILELNQVISYFNYANRVASGLGVDTDSEVLGLAPADIDDPDNWNHE